MFKLMGYIAIAMALNGRALTIATPSWNATLGDTYPGVASLGDTPCAPKRGDEGQGYICVCNSTYCDTIQRPDKLDKGLFYLYKTSNSTPGFTKSSGGFVKRKTTEANEVIFTINSTTEYQEIVGFGGAITDSAGLNINYLPKVAQEKLIESYYGPTGIEYSMLRVPIGSSDFSTRSYTLDDVLYDKDLEHFSLSKEDYDTRIPFIKSAMNISKKSIKLIGCTWASPSWMKNNNTVNAQFISSEYMNTWAMYHVRFLEEYQKEGIPVWALSAGNEVMILMVTRMQSLLNFTLETAPIQRSFIKHNLKPLLQSNNFSDVKILTLDDERLFAPYWMDRLANDPEALSEIDGIAFHTYFDKYIPASTLDDLHKAYPNTSIYCTETSINTGWGTNAVLLGSWDRAETYLTSIFENLNHWSRSYLDWNLALDVTGGPSLSYNIDAPVIVNQSRAEFYKQPLFYAMGHFSKFVLPGSKRVQVISKRTTSSMKDHVESEANTSKEGLEKLFKALKTSSISLLKRQSTSISADIQCIAFSNPDDSFTAIVLNTKNETVRVRLEDSRVGSVSLEIEEHSVNSVVYWP